MVILADLWRFLSENQGEGGLWRDCGQRLLYSDGWSGGDGAGPDGDQYDRLDCIQSV